MADIWKVLTKYKDYLPEETKGLLNQFEQIRPDLFRDPVDFTNPNTGAIGTGINTNTLPSAQSSLANKAYQAEVAGLAPKGIAEKAMAGGYIPDTRNKNIWGKIAAQTQFPLKKLMSALPAYSRVQAGVNIAQLPYKNYINEDQYKNLSIDEKLKLAANPANNRFAIAASGGKIEGQQKPVTKSEVKDISTAAWNALINKAGSPQENITTADYYKKIYPGVAKKAAWAEDTNDWKRGFNWIQKLGSGLIGSPADAMGLFTDIASDPIMHLWGGLGKGASVATTLEKDLVSPLGKTLLKAGSKMALTPEGKAVVEKVIKTGGEQLAGRFSKEIIGMTKDQAIRFIERKVSEEAIRSAIKTGAKTADSLIDYGGAKFMGQTFIKGAAFEQMAGLKQILNPAKLNEIPVLKWLNKAFNPFAGVPDEFKPLQAYVQSQAQARMAKELKNIQPIVKGLTKAEQDTIAKYAWLMGDIERIQGRGSKVTKALEDLTGKPDLKQIAKNVGITKKIAQLQAEIDKLNITPKIQEAYTKLRTWLDDLYVKDIKNVDVANLQKYYPHRYEGEIPTIVKSGTLGRKIPKFTQLQDTDWLTVQAQELKPKGFIDTLTERAWESTQREFRTNLTNEAKQFGQIVSKRKTPEGFVSMGDTIPELKGWALPKDYADTLGKTYNQFFGDDATKNFLKVYDKLQTIWKRWALATPGYHFRNFYSDNFSGLMQYGTDWADLRNWRDGINLLRGKDVDITDILGRKFVDNLDTFTPAGITNASTQSAVEGAIGGKTMRDIIGGGKQIGRKISPAEWSLKFGNKRENLGRAVAGIIERKSGNNLVNAAFNVKKVFFDYTNLTQFEKQGMKRIMPFYTWLRKNLERQFELLGKRTGRYAAIPKVTNYIENVADTNLGGDTEYQNIKPDYFKDLGIIRTGMRDNSGNALAFNPNLPFQDWSKLSPMSLFSSISPMLKIPIEIKTKKDIFFGTDIKTKAGYQDAPIYLNFLKLLPDSVLSEIGARKKEDGSIQISDWTVYAIKQLPMFSTLSRMLPATEQVKTPSQWGSVLAGVKMIPVETDKFKENKIKQTTTQLSDQLISENARRSESNKLPDLNNIERALKYIYSQKAAQQTGYDTILKLKEITKLSGSNKNINTLIDLKSQPYIQMIEKIKGMSVAELAAELKRMGIEPTMADINNTLTQIQQQTQ